MFLFLRDHGSLYGGFDEEGAHAGPSQGELVFSFHAWQFNINVILLMVSRTSA